MTETAPLSTNADTQLTPVAQFASAQSPVSNGHEAADQLIPEDEGEIKCICGIQEDDGLTVLCEKCNTWQHTACYYNTQEVPEVHECADCSPRPLDVKAATERQREKQRLRVFELANNGDRKATKRSAAPKAAKKKVRESANNGNIANGWSLDHVDRKSGSPKDGPPAKRPKTTHKPSTSITSLAQSTTLAPRKRAGSSAVNGHSPTKSSPTTPFSNGYTGEYFSPEFIQLYRKPDPPSMTENLYTNLSLPRELRSWLEDPDILAEVTGGMHPSEVFQRLGQSIEELESNAPHIEKNVEEDTNIRSHGQHPVWHWLSVNSYVPANSFIGELRGHISRKKDYCESSSNRWNLLRHPEPFVFFPPHLPLVIDARKEGTIMRYARRSCDPNMVMRIFITGSNYHFCFVATKDIVPGEELTVGWDIDQDIHRALSSGLSNGTIYRDGIRSIEELSQWVAGVLSNFGGCACNRPRGDCYLERADRRNGTYLSDNTVQSLKLPKQRRTKKLQASPLGTGQATNSRANSEIMNRGDGDDVDMRSVSGSSRSKPGSRDITPMTHVSNDFNAGLGLEMSAREKRKMEETERLFEQLEQGEQQGSKKKKRNSAGSLLNTPAIGVSVSLIFLFRVADALSPVVSVMYDHHTFLIL
jgi:uncharacterized protein